jgi:integrase/recombinase XerD
MPRTSPLIKSFISYLTIERGLLRNTTDSYTSDLVRLQTWATQNKLTLRGLTGRDIDRHIGHLTRSNLNPTSITRALSAIRTFYDFLVFESEVTTNPTLDIPSPKRTRPLPHVLTSGELDRLLNSPDTSTPEGLRDRALLELLSAAGLRISELVKLRHRDIAIDRRLLQCLGKGNKERQVPFTATAADWLTKYIRAEHPRSQPRSSQSIFLNQGHPLTRQFTWSIIKHYAELCNLPDVTPHSLRHTFATSLLENGMSTMIVQQLLGHASISTTEIYLTVSKSHLRRSYERHHPRAHSSANAKTNP